MRRFISFLASRWPELTLLGICEVLIAFVASSTPVSRDVTILLVATVAVAWGMALAVSFGRARHSAREFEAISRAAHPLDTAAKLPPLHGPEGKAAAGAIETLHVQARSRLAESAQNYGDYRDYVESWVHEVKTPIAAARLALDNNPGPGSAQIASQLDRIGFLVDQALYYARSSTLNRDYFIHEYTLAEVAAEAVRERRRQLFDAGMAVDLGGIEADARVLCDDKWLVFMIGQILDNAVKYRSESPRIALSSACEGVGARSRIVLTIEDNGEGISAADLPRIFDKGFTGAHGRVGEASSRATGLGLYLVGKLAQAMAMEAWAESEEGTYTRIHLAFPVPA